MFRNYESRSSYQPKEVIEMEDIEIDDEDDARPVNTQPQQTNFTPATFKIEPRTKNHINAAAMLVMGDQKKAGNGPLISPKGGNFGNQENDMQQANENARYLNQQGNDFSVKISVQRPETQIKSPHKPKIHGRLLGNLSALAPKMNLQNNTNNNNQSILGENPNRLLPDRKRGLLAEKDPIPEPVEAPRVPKRKLIEPNTESNDLFAGDPIIELNKKPRSKLLTNLL